MALVQYGGGIIQMRGSIGGNTFSRNKSGNYVRGRTVPINPNTGRQSEVRAIMASIVAVWGASLSAAQKAAWALYAQNIEFTNTLGETHKLSGFNHYVRSNSVRLLVGLSRLDDAPTLLELPGQDPDFDVRTSTNSALAAVTFDQTAPWASEDSAAMAVYMGQPVSSARSFFGGPFRFIGTLDGNSGSPITSPQDLTDLPWVASPGQKVAFKGRILRADGRLSDFFHDELALTNGD